MTEETNPKRPTERETEESLRRVGSDLEYPPTPDVSQAVRQELESETEARSRRRLRGWTQRSATRWAVAGMLLVVLAVPAVLAAAMGGFWSSAGQSGGAGVSQSGAGGGAADGASDEAADLPDSAAGPVSRESSEGGDDDLGGELGLEGPISVREARELADFEVLTPNSADLSRPDEVYRPDEESFILLYRAGSGLPEIGGTGLGMVISERPGDIDSAYPDALETDADYETVPVGGDTGYWFPNGRKSDLQNGESRPLPGGVLLLERDGTTIEVRSVLSRDAAVEVADNLR